MLSTTASNFFLLFSGAVLRCYCWFCGDLKACFGRVYVVVYFSLSCSRSELLHAVYISCKTIYS